MATKYNYTPEDPKKTKEENLKIIEDLQKKYESNPTSLTKEELMNYDNAHKDLIDNHGYDSGKSNMDILVQAENLKDEDGNWMPDDQSQIASPTTVTPTTAINNLYDTVNGIPKGISPNQDNRQNAITSVMPEAQAESKKILKHGDRGEDVKEMQRGLIRDGFLPEKNEKGGSNADGDFGKRTQDAIVASQTPTNTFTEQDANIVLGEWKPTQDNKSIVPDLNPGGTKTDLTGESRWQLSSDIYGQTTKQYNNIDKDSNEDGLKDANPAKKKEREEDTSMDDFRRAIVAMMGENVDQNKKDIQRNRFANDALSVGEMLHNINEPEYEGSSVPEPHLAVAQKMDTKPMLDRISRSKNAQIKNLMAQGRNDLIPSVIEAANDETNKVRMEEHNLNMQSKMQVDQFNATAKNQGIQLGLQNTMFDKQMGAQHEQLRGAAISENLTNLRDSSRDAINSMTANRDNQISQAMYAAALDDPKLAAAMLSKLINKSDKDMSQSDKDEIRKAKKLEEEKNRVIIENAKRNKKIK